MTMPWIKTPSYQHKIISQVDPFPIRDPVVFLADAIMADEEATI